MVTTQKQILEKMLGRRLTESEWKKLSRLSHNEALLWAKAIAIAEGRTQLLKKNRILNKR